jgi:hypothetical protein
MTGTCANRRREITFTKGRRLREHLLDPKDPMGPRYLGRDPVKPLPKRVARRT